MNVIHNKTHFKMFESKNKSILIFTSPYVDTTLFPPSDSDTSLAEGK